MPVFGHVRIVQVVVTLKMIIAWAGTQKITLNTVVVLKETITTVSTIVG